MLAAIVPQKSWMRLFYKQSSAVLVAHDCGHPLSHYTCRATRVAADFLDFIAFCRCSTGVALHPLKILVSHLPPPLCPGGVAPKFGSEKVSRYTGVSQLQLRVSRYTVQLRLRSFCVVRRFRWGNRSQKTKPNFQVLGEPRFTISQTYCIFPDFGEPFQKTKSVATTVWCKNSKTKKQISTAGKKDQGNLAVKGQSPTVSNKKLTRK